MSIRHTIARIRHAVEQGVLCSHKNDTEFRTFEENHPTLYEMVTEKNCNMEMLNKLLELHEGIQSGNVQQEDADVSFGQLAAEHYVNPLVQNKDS